MKKFSIAELGIGLLVIMLFIVAFVAGIYDTYYFIQGPINARDYMRLIIGGITFSILGVLALGGWIYNMYKKHNHNKKPA